MERGGLIGGRIGSMADPESDTLLSVAQAASLLIVVAILYVRPQGLFGQRVEVA